MTRPTFIRGFLAAAALASTCLTQPVSAQVPALTKVFGAAVRAEAPAARGAATRAVGEGAVAGALGKRLATETVEAVVPRSAGRPRLSANYGVSGMAPPSNVAGAAAKAEVGIVDDVVAKIPKPPPVQAAPSAAASGVAPRPGGLSFALQNLKSLGAQVQSSAARLQVGAAIRGVEQRISTQIFRAKQAFFTRARQARDRLAKLRFFQNRRGAEELAAKEASASTRAAAITAPTANQGRAPTSAGTRSLPVPEVTDPNLKNIVRSLYKGTKTPAPIGTGSTADAIRNERATGQLTFGVDHARTKGPESVAALKNWLKRNPNASSHDKLVAESLKSDLEDAMQSK